MGKVPVALVPHHLSPPEPAGRAAGAEGFGAAGLESGQMVGHGGQPTPEEAGASHGIR
jgi:hypothetical protein